MRKTVFAAGLSLLTAHAHAATVTIVNKTSLEFHEVYLAPTTESDWGEDRLDDYILEPGNQMVLTNVAPGKWKLRIVDEDEDECVFQDQKIVMSTSFAVSDDDFLSCRRVAH